MNELREQAGRKLHVYMSRSGMTLGEIAGEIGYSTQSLKQFASHAQYGDSDGHVIAKAVTDWIDKNPVPPPALPGKLYETRATRDMDNLLRHINNGGWGSLYGPSGAQKSFLLEYRFAESARAAEPEIVYIRASAAGMTPPVLLQRIAAQIGAPAVRYTDGMRQSVLYAIRRRSAPLALVIDEADALFRWIETLETLREIGDLARPKVGILVVGNERVAANIFQNRRSFSFEKWRGRIEQEELRVLGPSEEEATRIVAEELGVSRKEPVQRLVEGCMVQDPISRKRYVSMHRLFNSIKSARHHQVATVH